MKNSLRNSFGFAQIPLMIVLMVMAAAVPVATTLVQKTADNRNYAKEVVDCKTGYHNDGKGNCIKDATRTPTAKPTSKPSACSNSCAASTCSNQTCVNTCGTTIQGTKSCPICSDSCATVTCSNQTCVNTCGKTIQGLKSCAVPATSTPRPNSNPDLTKKCYCSSNSSDKQCGWYQEGVNPVGWDIGSGCGAQPTIVPTPTTKVVNCSRFTDALDCGLSGCSYNFGTKKCETKSTGMKSNGTGCLFDTDCLSGNCALNGIVKMCAAKKVVGTGCVANNECASNSCISFKCVASTAGYCQQDAACPGGYHCSNLTCVPNKKIGDSCAYDSDCAPNSCTGVIGFKKCTAGASNLPIGSVCTFDLNCSSGLCSGVGTARRCVGGSLPLGAKCLIDGECASKICDKTLYGDDICVASNTNVPDNGFCTRNAQCKSNICRFDHCLGLGGLQNGARCLVDAECTSKTCDHTLYGDDICVASNKDVPDNGFCTNNAQCKSGTCRFDRCLGSGGLQNGAKCLLDSECASKTCDHTLYGDDICVSANTNVPDGDYCTNNAQCKSKICRFDHCLGSDGSGLTGTPVPPNACDAVCSKPSSDDCRACKNGTAPTPGTGTTCNSLQSDNYCGGLKPNDPCAASTGATCSGVAGGACYCKLPNSSVSPTSTIPTPTKTLGCFCANSCTSNSCWKSTGAVQQDGAVSCSMAACNNAPLPTQSPLTCTPKCITGYDCVLNAANKPECVPAGQEKCNPGDVVEQASLLGCSEGTKRVCTCLSSRNWSCICDGDGDQNLTCMDSLKGSSYIKKDGSKGWLHFDNEASAICVCGVGSYHQNTNGKYLCGPGNGDEPTTVPPTLPPIGGSCTQCPNDFKCYRNGGEYKWFVTGYVMSGFNAVNDDNCGGVPKPLFLGKQKGDATCDGNVDTADYALWHKEFYDGDAGAVSSKTWHADFTGPNGVCDGKVDTADYALWHKYFYELMN